MTKTNTDLFWNSRPNTQSDPRKVNIDDLVQREIEADFIVRHLTKNDDVLEVGCGNGFFATLLRENVKYLDSFDYAENMVEQAKEVYGEENNRFFHDNLLEPKNINKTYDVVVCLRVLINLADFEQQKIAFNNMLSWVKPGGKLILVEGFSEGFENLNKLRVLTGIEKLKPAAINYYSSHEQFVRLFPKNVSIVDSMHTGSYDFLTRIVYPSLVGAENATGVGEFHERIINIARQYNPSDMKPLARLLGWALQKSTA